MSTLCLNCHNRFDPTTRIYTHTTFCSIACRLQWNKLSIEDMSQAFHMWARESKRRLNWTDKQCAEHMFYRG